MSNVNQTIQMLIILLVGAVFILFILTAVYLILKRKEKNEQNRKINDIDMSSNNASIGNKNSRKSNDSQTEMYKKSVFDFMEFDKIEDNMIVQKNGKKCVMVVECQGINYDLMSQVEKTSVEEGFVQFLNTLRHPIQIYVQTRTINLEQSINTYKRKLNEIEANLFRMRQRYQEMQDAGTHSKEELEKAFFELTKQNNLYEYGRDIIYNTEKMSLNKNILSKKYYIVISYYTSEIEKSEDYDNKELLSMAFSELYNRAQSIIRTISACGVTARILNSVDLTELLYVAYNRDESETFDLKKAIRAEYDSLYSTAPDVLEKRMKELDKIIEEKAINKVTEKIEKVMTKNREKLDQKEASIDELADEMAKIILEENRQYLGSDLVDSIMEEEEKANEKKKTKKQSRATN